MAAEEEGAVAVAEDVAAEEGAEAPLEERGALLAAQLPPINELVAKFSRVCPSPFSSVIICDGSKSHLVSNLFFVCSLS